MTNAPLPQFAVDAASYQRLRPLMRTLAHDEDVARLARGLALSDGFAFHLVSCETPQIAQALLLCLAKEVPELRGSPVKVTRLVPTRAPDEPLESWALGREFFDRVFIPDPEPRIICLDATDSRSDDRDAWLWLLQRLNERRNHLYALGVPLLFLFPFELAIELTRFAPDLWSIRGVGLKLRDVERRSLDASEAPYRFTSPETAAMLPARAELESSIAELLLQRGPHAKRALAVEMRRLAELLHERGETAQALDLLNHQVLPHLMDSPPELRAALMVDAVEILVRLGQAETAEELARNALLPDLERHLPQGIAALLLSRVADAYREQGNLGKALTILRDEVLPKLTKSDAPERHAEIYSKLVVTLSAMGQLDQVAEVIHDKASLLEALSPRIAAAMFMSLAHAFWAQGNPSASARLLEDHVLPLCTRAAAPEIESLALMVLGHTHFDRGELREAIHVWRERAVPLYRRLGKTADAALAQTWIARALDELGQREAATLLLEQTTGAWRTWEVATVRDALTRRDALIQLARGLAAHEDHSQALQLLRQALDADVLWKEEREALEEYLAELEGSAPAPQPRSLEPRTQAGPEVFADAEPERERSSDS